MIITRTPYRLSLFGGGTDYNPWFEEHGGLVIAAAMGYYCYLSVRPLPPFFEDHTSRVVYSKIESVLKHSDIQHPAVRGCLEYLGISDGVEIHHDGDLPARSGLGSSSSFTVGMVNAMNALKGVYSSSHELASAAIHIEQDLIKECVGSQDQISAAYGGFNEIEFYKDDTFSVEPMVVDQDRIKDLNHHLMLFFTGISRFSSKIAESQVSNIKNCHSQMNELYDMVGEGSSILSNTNTPIDEFGKLLNKAWENKKSLSDKVTN